jgi:hypothetical protein
VPAESEGDKTPLTRYARKIANYSVIALPEEHSIVARIVRVVSVAALTFAALVGLSPAAASAAGGPVVVGSDGYARFDVQPHGGAVEIWVELEDPTLAPADVIVKVNGAPKPIASGPFGVIAVSPASSSVQHIAIAVTKDATPDVALTVVDATDTVVESFNYRITLVDYRTLTDSAGAPATGNPLAITGFDSPFLLGLVVTALALAATGLFLIRRAKKTKT